MDTHTIHKTRGTLDMEKVSYKKQNMKLYNERKQRKKLRGITKLCVEDVLLLFKFTLISSVTCNGSAVVEWYTAASLGSDEPWGDGSNPQ